LVQRLGLAIARPRWALTLGADRRHAGRSGSDLMGFIALVLLATELRWLVKAAWLGGVVGLTVGLRAAVHVVTRVLTVDLGILVVAAAALFGLGGPRREIGRAFDVACVATLPLLFVELAFGTVVHLFGLDVPPLAGLVIAAAGYAWCGTLVGLGTIAMRRVGANVEVPGEVARPARIAGRAVLAVVVAGLVAEGLWLRGNVDNVRPISDGDRAPAFALPTITARGELGPPVALASLAGQVVVVEFWATWCAACRAALPQLDALVRKHPELVVLAVDLDDAKQARAMFDEAGYQLRLVADDGEVSERYGVSPIPHTVVIDREGRVRGVFRGNSRALEPLVEGLLK
jgi:thiol-disulfide isomerase/thioredoxin